MEMLFKLAGLAMCTNVLCSLVLLAKLHNDPLAGELFALPNAWLGPRPRWLGIRLLRAKFFLPWVPSPRGLSESSLGTRAVFFLARMSGVAFPIAILAFLASSFILAGR
jgi:hypothetical protein